MTLLWKRLCGMITLIWHGQSGSLVVAAALPFQRAMMSTLKSRELPPPPSPEASRRLWRECHIKFCCDSSHWMSCCWHSHSIVVSVTVYKVRKNLKSIRDKDQCGSVFFFFFFFFFKHFPISQNRAFCWFFLDISITLKYVIFRYHM
mgnify:CR=1 FL=1